MKIAVLKFGGTSVASDEAREKAIGHIRSYLDRGFAVVSVVSAMGRKGAPYATDTLLSLIDSHSDPYTRDLLMSCGETISASVFADALSREGIPAVPMNGMTAGIRTEGEHLASSISGMETDRVIKALGEGKTVVITGFQGVNDAREVTTLGRGGSDTSAIAIAGFLKATEAVIYTDVPGVAEADPRIVPEARFIPEIDFEDMLLLASSGAGVVHPRAVEAGMRFSADFYVRSTFDELPGTHIMKLSPKPSGFIGITATKPAEGKVVVTALKRPLGGSDVAAARKALEERELTFEQNLIRAELPAEEANAAIKTLYGCLAD